MSDRSAFDGWMQCLEHGTAWRSYCLPCSMAQDHNARRHAAETATAFSPPRPEQGPYRAGLFEGEHGRGWIVRDGDQILENFDFLTQEAAERQADLLNAAWRRGMEDA